MKKEKHLQKKVIIKIKLRMEKISIIDGKIRMEKNIDQ